MLLVNRVLNSPCTRMYVVTVGVMSHDVVLGTVAGNDSPL